MVEFRSHDPGSPSWIDVSAPDMDASIAFYTGLFGWTCEQAGPVEETGGYRMFQLRGRNVAGIGPHQDGSGPPMWTTYLASADVDATATKITSAGGAVFVEPMDVLDAGRMLIAADVTGAAFGVWQAGTHTGAELANEPGAYSWNELNTRDIGAAIAFYGEVFGWQGETHGEGPESYTEFLLDARPIAGCLDMDSRGIPNDVPAHWLTYFSVEDIDPAVTRAGELGGKAVTEAMDIEPGRFAVLEDPAGAFFCVITLADAS